MQKKTITQKKPEVRFPEFSWEWEEKKFSDFLNLQSRAIPKPVNPYKAIGIRSHFKGTFQKLDSDPAKIAMKTLYRVKKDDLIINIPFLGMVVSVGLWDAVVASLSYIFIAPLLTIAFQNPLFLLAYIIDAPVTLIPVMTMAIRRREIVKAFVSFPSFFVLRFVNCFFILEAFVSEVILQKRLTVYEKGH